MTNNTSTEWKEYASQLLGIQEDDILSILHKYIYSSPEKYYNKEAFEEYYGFLNKSLVENENLLLEFLNNRQESVNISYKILANINNKKIHECIVKDDDATFIDEHINYNYLQLLEGSLSIHVQLATYLLLISQGKKTENLDLYACIEKLSKHGFKYISKTYDHNIRNGIGHGKIIYEESKANYIDKKEQQASIYYFQFIRKFDLLLDIVNGFTLAYIKFWINKLNHLKIDLPRQLLFEEIKLSNTLKRWSVTTVIHQQILQKRQLAVKVESKCVSQKELENNITETAIRTSKIAENRFDILHINITHNNFPGFVDFDINKLNNIENIPAFEYKHLLETITNSLEMYLAGFSENMPASMNPNIFINKSSEYSLVDINNYVGKLKYKDINQHVSAKNQYMIIETRYTYNELDTSTDNVVESIKSLLCRIKYHSLEKSNELSKLYEHKIIPIKYLSIWIYEEDKRVRNLNSNGIKPNLICKIVYNETDHIRNINLLDSHVEKFQGAIFNWNHYWRNPDAYEAMFPE